MQCTLKSSNGDVIFDAASGVVTEVRESSDPSCEGSLSPIFLIDVKRLLELMGPELIEEGETDILFAGYWYSTEDGEEGYEGPAEEAIRLAQNHAGAFIL